jgi:hypothetical protein
MIPIGTIARLFQGRSVSSVLSDHWQTHMDNVDYLRISAGGHWDLVAGVQDGGELGQTLGHGSSEDHVPCREEEGCGSSISYLGF